MSLTSFCIKYKRPLCLIIFILLGFILFHVSASIKEGFNVSGLTKVESCIDASIKNNCTKCISSYFGSTGSETRCAWHMNPSNNQYSCVTSDPKTTPIGELSCPIDTYNTKPGCSACPKLKLLDTPTWLLDQ
jgi:hypothetical protein